MQFFLFDVMLAFAALLGYRALAAVAHQRAPVVARDGRTMPRARALEPKAARSKRAAVSPASRPA
jgi:hypothetical protein